MPNLIERIVLAQVQPQLVIGYTNLTTRIETEEHMTIGFRLTSRKHQVDPDSSLNEIKANTNNVLNELGVVQTSLLCNRGMVTLALYGVPILEIEKAMYITHDRDIMGEYAEWCPIIGQQLGSPNSDPDPSMAGNYWICPHRFMYVRQGCVTPVRP